MRRKKPKSPKERGVSHSLQAWATAFGMERRTLEARMVKAGLTVSKNGALIPARKIYVALVGDKQAEEIRALKLDNEERERRAAESDGRLVDRQLIEQQLTEFFTLPLMQALVALPTTLDARCNPGDPALARVALQQWVEETKRLTRERLPK
jgi:hypothetical protein